MILPFLNSSSNSFYPTCNCINMSWC